MPLRAFAKENIPFPKLNFSDSLKMFRIEITNNKDYK